MTKTSPFLLAALLWPLAAPAQPIARADPHADPLEAKLSTPPLVYRSALAGYHGWSVESPPVAWREANDAVARIGGWRAYAREAAAPQTPAPAASAPPVAPMPAHKE
jgi:hypothetical protein